MCLPFRRFERSMSHMPFASEGRNRFHTHVPEAAAVASLLAGIAYALRQTRVRLTHASDDTSADIELTMLSR
jgi:hypothetical protein